MIEEYSSSMRLTVAHLREALMVAGVGLIAFAAIRGADRLLGHGNPFLPGSISLIFVAAWIFLLSRYGRRPNRPLDPRRRRLMFLFSIAASGALAMIGAIVSMWLRWA